jgi:hypothetical protein
VAGVKNVIKQLYGMQVAGMYAEDDSARFRARRFYLEFLGIIELEQCFLGGMRNFFGGRMVVG